MASERAPPFDLMKSSTGRRSGGPVLEARVLTFDVEGIGVPESGGQAGQRRQHQHESEDVSSANPPKQFS